MVRVERRGLAGRTLRAASRVTRRKKPYKIVFESVTQEKKKLRSAVSYNAQAPPGYTFVPAGIPELSEFCKEISRKRGLVVHIVSATPKNKASTDPNKVSHHVHRIGYHFPNAVVDQACDWLGYSSRRGMYQKDLDIISTSHLARSLAGHSKRLGLDKRTGSEQENKEQVKAAIRDLFPKIPDNDLFDIVDHAFREGTARVGNAAELSLPRRVQLAVVAHIRHVYTDYDKLLKTGTYLDARAKVEQVCLDHLVEWRGENDDGQTELEDIFRETIVIDDDDDDDEDDDESEQESSTFGDDRARSVEIISSQAAAHELQPEEYTPAVYQGNVRSFRAPRRIIVIPAARQPYQSYVQSTARPPTSRMRTQPTLYGPYHEGAPSVRSELRPRMLERGVVYPTLRPVPRREIVYVENQHPSHVIPRTYRRVLESSHVPPPVPEPPTMRTSMRVRSDYEHTELPRQRVQYVYENKTRGALEYPLNQPKRLVDTRVFHTRNVQNSPHAQNDHDRPREEHIIQDAFNEQDNPIPSIEGAEDGESVPPLSELHLEPKSYKVPQHRDRPEYSIHEGRGTIYTEPYAPPSGTISTMQSLRPFGDASTIAAPKRKRLPSQMTQTKHGRPDEAQLSARYEVGVTETTYGNIMHDATVGDKRTQAVGSNTFGTPDGRRPQVSGYLSPEQSHADTRLVHEPRTANVVHSSRPNQYGPEPKAILTGSRNGGSHVLGKNLHSSTYDTLHRPDRSRPPVEYRPVPGRPGYQSISTVSKEPLSRGTQPHERYPRTLAHESLQHALSSNFHQQRVERKGSSSEPIVIDDSPSRKKRVSGTDQLPRPSESHNVTDSSYRSKLRKKLMQPDQPAPQKIRTSHQKDALQTRHMMKEHALAEQVWDNY